MWYGPALVIQSDDDVAESVPSPYHGCLLLAIICYRVEVLEVDDNGAVLASKTTRNVTVLQS